jgi:hypothetical protein
MSAVFAMLDRSIVTGPTIRRYFAGAISPRLFSPPLFACAVSPGAASAAVLRARHALNWRR